MRHARTIEITGIALVLAAAVAIGVIAAGQQRASDWVDHSIEVRGTARQLLITLLNAETGQRGFLLSGADPRYLQPFSRASRQLPQQIGRLMALTADNSDQQARVAELKSLTQAKFEELRRNVALARSGQTGAAIAMLNTGRGKLLMDGIRARIAAFLATEQALLAQREAEARWMRSVLLIFIAFALIAAVLLSVLLGRANAGAIAALRARTAELEAEIARRQQAENTLRQVQKMEAVGQLTGGIAHDFNNLLTIILGNLDTLKRRAADPVLAKPIEHALQGARSAAQLTQRLLAFSRRQMLAPIQLDLNRLVQDMSDLLRRTLGETIDVETVLSGGLWTTFADANQLENALLNLAINARDAMPKGGRLTIETANASLDDAYVARFGDIAAGQYVLLIVSDTGSGIAPDVLEHVFEPFFTTKGPTAGSGLGLSMVHGFVRQSGGHVRIYSEAGHGTTVKIYLPRLTDAKEAASVPGPMADVHEPVARATRGEAVLIVEDNKAVREYAAEALAELGYTTHVASTAEEALAILERGERIHLLFTDVVLPGGMSGRDLAKRAAVLRPELPVLYTTGYTRNAIVHGGRLDPGVHLLHKPYTLHELARKVREEIDREAVG